MAPLDLLRLAALVRENGWAEESAVKETDTLQAEHAKRSHWTAGWWVRNYLYLRIPLLNPDRFLARTLPGLGRFLCVPVAVVLALLLGVGLFFLFNHSAEYIHTFAQLFTLRNLIYFGLAVTLVKAIHEFAHAYAAKAMGIRVPAMGVALMVLWPVAYCDVTDGWRLRSRRQRLLISGAGILAELVIAAIALFVWGMTLGTGETGVLHTLAFFFSSSTLASTLLVNLNPAMRFDGYYLLMDLWGVDNLQQRAFAAARWWFRERLLGVGAPPPEEGLSRGHLMGMVAYSLYAWVYRFFLFIGIAVLVYYKFGKLLGSVLFLVEIALFLGAPVVRELACWKALLAERAWPRRSLWTVALFALVLLWAALPLPRRTAFPAVVVPEAGDSWALYAPGSGRVTEVLAGGGRWVRDGQTLLRVESASLNTEIASLEMEIQLLQRRVVQLLLDASKRGELREARDQLKRVEGVYRSRLEQQQRNHLRAPAEGVVWRWDEAIRPGEYILQGTELGGLQDPRRGAVAALIPESYIAEIQVGQAVHLLLASGWDWREGRVVQVVPSSLSGIDDEGELSTLKSQLPVRGRLGGVALLAGNHYRVEIAGEGIDGTEIGRTGEVWIWTGARSLLWDVMRSAWNRVLAESSL
jgi:putative peptide zinc metalloprotease protein